MKDQNVKILHLEDLPTDSALAEREIKKVLDDYTIRLVENEAGFIHELKEFNPDIVISDFQLPSFDGLSALKIVLRESPTIPVIILTGSMNEDTAVDCMKAGATDYVIKGHIKRLGSAILNALEQKETIAEKKRTEEALLQSEENFRRSISESPLGIRIVSVEGNTIYANKAFLSIYDFCCLDEFTNTPAVHRYTPESYLQHQERKMLRKTGQDVFDYEISILRKKSDIRQIKVSRQEILWNGVKHFQVINQDITEQKKLTRELIKAKEKAEESDRLKTAFLHNISHEIRTPMNAIFGFSELLNQPGLSTEKIAEFTSIILRSSKQLLCIINDIISIATVEAGQEQITEKKVNINLILKILHDQFLVKASQKNIDLQLSPNDFGNDFAIITDEKKIIQILSNLIDNGIKFTKQGQVTYGFTVKGCIIEFFVSDTGIGIPEEMHEEIFKRFRQVETTTMRHYGGSGLGLSISKAYVELLGGKMWVNSEIGAGSTFYFTLPLKEDKLLASPVAPAPKENDLQNSPAFTLLIAEDEDSNYLLLEEFLSDTNIHMIRALNGEEALEICKTKQVDMVLMDLKMPIMDGYEATRLILELKPKLPIIAQSAYITEADRQKALAYGCVDYITKPISESLLISKIMDHLA